jgi:hypothetical protein
MLHSPSLSRIALSLTDWTNGTWMIIYREAHEPTTHPPPPAGRAHLIVDARVCILLRVLARVPRLDQLLGSLGLAQVQAVHAWWLAPSAPARTRAHRQERGRGVGHRELRRGERQRSPHTHAGPALHLGSFHHIIELAPLDGPQLTKS